jgi:hypothetical protein
MPFLDPRGCLILIGWREAAIGVSFLLRSTAPLAIALLALVAGGAVLDRS